MSIISISGRIGSGKDLTGKIIQYLVAQSKVGWTLPYTIEEYINGKDVYNVNHRKDYSESISEDSGWEIKKFTDKLKDIVCILLGCTREQLEDREFKEKELGEEWWYYQNNISGNIKNINEFERINNLNMGLFTPHYNMIKPTPRLLFQLIGTECMRNIIHPDTWINALMCEYKEKITTESFYDIKTNNYTGITNKSKNNFPNWIITDMRFPNELKAVKDKGGICIRIERGRTSDEWQKRYPLIKVLDPDGWNRDERYHYEWYEEKITLQEYKNRVMRSTCKFTVDIKTFFSEHESETALDHITDWDYVIDNNSTIEDLVVKIEEILIKEQIIKKNGNTL